MTRTLFVFAFLSFFCSVFADDAKYGNSPIWEVGPTTDISQTMSGNRRVCEKIIRAEVLWAMLNPTKKLSSDFEAAWTKPDTKEKDVDAILAKIVEDSPMLKKGTKNDILLVNTLSRDRWGIWFIGNVPKTDKKLAMYKNNVGNVLPVQAVDDPGSETVSLYADFGFGEKPGPVSALEMMSLSLDETATIPEIPSSLFIDAETGEMGNDLFRLVIDKQSGAIKSLKLKNVDHEFVGTEPNSLGGLNNPLCATVGNITQDYWHNRGTAKLTVVASGPLAASMLIESSLGLVSTPNTVVLQRQITIFADSEKIRIENIFNGKSEQKKPDLTFFAFPFNMPGGKWFFDTPLPTANDNGRNHNANLNHYVLYRYAVCAGENVGVNWVTVDANVVRFTPIVFQSSGPPITRFLKGPNSIDTLYSWADDFRWKDHQSRFEYWIWPYAASFDNSIAQRFARQVHQPLVRIDGVTTVKPPAKWLMLENYENIVISSVRPTQDGSGALLVRLFNTSPNPLSTTLRFPSPGQEVYRSNPLGDRLEKLDDIPLAPWETVLVRVE